MSATGARIGGLEFVADGREAMFTLDDESLSGWLETPEMRHERTQRSTAHGEFRSPGYLSGRVVTFSGLMFADSPEQYVRRLSMLSGLLADGSEDRLVVDLELGATWADVSRYGKPSLSHEVWGSIARYQMHFWAPDAERYGVTRVFPGPSTEVFHYGNFEASPVATVTGFGPYTVYGSGGKRFVVSAPLSLGQTDVIDFRTGRVRRDGVLLMGGVSRAETWSISPGKPFTMTVSEGRSMSVSVADTWV